MQIMGIINVTPDSFAERDETLEKALEHAEKLIAEGADIIDVGPESTRPGAGAVPAREQIRRALPLIRTLRGSRPSIPISIDTTDYEVAAAAVEAGAGIINDVGMLRSNDKLAALAAETGVELILCHSRGTPETMRDCCRYGDVVKEVYAELEMAKNRAIELGVKPEKIIVDPGIGFAKTADQSWELLRKIEEFKSLGRVLAGHSRKSFLDGLDRVGGSIGAALALAEKGVDIVRLHDVGLFNSALAAYLKTKNR